MWVGGALEVEDALALAALHARLCCPTVLYCSGPCRDFASPSWTVPGKRLPCVGVDVQVFEGHLVAVLELLLLTIYDYAEPRTSMFGNMQLYDIMVK